jgi:protein SCO1
MRLLVTLSLSLALAGCRGGAAPPDAEFEARPDARRFDIAGRVVSLDRNARQMTLAHDEVKGFMSAMTMTFTLKERWAFDAAAPGDALRGTLVVDGARSWIEGVSVTRGDPSAAPVAAKGSWAPADPGTPLPDLTFVDQDGRALPLATLRGQPLLLTFSYISCPLEEYCPLMMQRFAALEKATSADPALRTVRLLTVTLDPEHDTPARLKEYGSKYAGGGRGPDRFRRWTLATGKPDEVKKLAGFFGLDYYTETTGQVIHSLRTALIDREGRVVKVLESNTWQVADVLRALGEVAAPPS